jgi:predicted outer membrane lipoprotein
VASSMVNAWLLTIPVTAAFGYVVALLADRIP